MRWSPSIASLAADSGLAFRAFWQEIKGQPLSHQGDGKTLDGFSLTRAASRDGYDLDWDGANVTLGSVDKTADRDLQSMGRSTLFTVRSRGTMALSAHRIVKGGHPATTRAGGLCDMAP